MAQKLLNSERFFFDERSNFIAVLRSYSSQTPSGVKKKASKRKNIYQTYLALCLQPCDWTFQVFGTVSKPRLSQHLAGGVSRQPGRRIHALCDITKNCFPENINLVFLATNVGPFFIRTFQFWVGPRLQSYTPALAAGGSCARFVHIILGGLRLQGAITADRWRRRHLF